MPTTTVAAVIFDLGGVLIDWDPRYLYRKLFAADDEAGMERFLAEVCTAAWNHELDGGRPFAEAVAELSLRHPAQRGHIEAYHQRWTEMIGGPIRGTVDLLEALAARDVLLYAITNWSAETFLLVRQDPAYAFLDRFRGIFVSGELGMVKPEPAIFRHALGRIGCSADECLFIDDIERNIAVARTLGFVTHRFTTPDALAFELRVAGLIA